MCIATAAMLIGGALLGGVASSLMGTEGPEAPPPVKNPAKQAPEEARSFANRNKMNTARRRALARPDIKTSPLGLTGGGQPGATGGKTVLGG